MKTFHIASVLFLTCISISAAEPMIVAHRGASRDAPENTIPAFKLAWEQGADAIEGDFLLTKDGHIVCIHDKSTKRFASVNLPVKGTTLKNLRELDVGIRKGEKYKGTIIPTISEVFATVPATKKVFIEIKCGTEIIPPLLDQIAKSSLKKEQIVVICFNKNVLKEFKYKAPWCKTSWLCSIRKNKSGKLIPSLETVLTALREMKADGFSSGKNGISEDFVKGVMDKGYEYHVWTVDDTKTAMRFNKWGAKSITTNVPAHIKKAIVEQGAALDADKLRK
jgi:glycerophosphoryl diester phosphodiesterase